MRFSAYRSLVGYFLAVAFISATPAAAQGRYMLTEIEPLRGDIATGAWDINNQSEVVATSSRTNDLDLGYGKSMIWKNGESKRLLQLSDGTSFAFRINNQGIAWGMSSDGQGPRPIFWRGGAVPVRLPSKPNIDQFQAHGLSDLGLMTGTASVFGGSSMGFLYDLNLGRLDFNPTYVFGDLNARGDMIRSLAEGPITLEVTTSKGVFPLNSPQGLRQTVDNARAKIGPLGVVTAPLVDDDASDQCLGCGSSCVRWDPPSYSPVVFNPPEFRSRDNCHPGRTNKAGDVLVMHAREIGRDEYTFVPMVVFGGSFFTAVSLCPELARFEEIALSAINDKREIVGTGRRDGVYRGFILRPLDGTTSLGTMLQKR